VAAGVLVIASFVAASALSGAAGVDAPTAGRGDRTYVVRQGDTLWSIAEGLDLSGSIGDAVQVLEAANPGTFLQAGQRLRIPAVLLESSGQE
jgi:Tfp pilus assembly protein FimV